MNYNFLIIGFVLILSFKLVTIFINNKDNTKIKKLSKQATEIDAKDFIKMRNDKTKKKQFIYNDFQGVYILLNKNKKIYYVGQSINILKRVNNHFSGKGNGDVYADFKYGDTFTITTIPLENSGFKNLNDLEKQAITVFKAYKKGYNKTRGNK